MPLSIQLRFIPTLSALCVGALVACICLSLIFIPNTHSIRDEFIANYGNALANMAAKQAVDATFNHDLVRLQVILQDAVANPHTHFATIHDVENNLLVQAGQASPADATHATFTSPIILHDSVAGYVSITLIEKTWSLQSAIMLTIAIALFCAALALWSLFRSQALVWESRPEATKTEDDSDEATQGLAENSRSDDMDDTDASLPEVYAVVHIKNLNVLKQQLNGASFRDTIARLEHIISDVLALYGGHRFELVDNYYVLRFQERDNRGEALFNASCSAYLILELAGIIDKIPLDLAALVSANAEHIVPEKLPFAGLIVEASAGAETMINRRIEFMDLGTEDGRQVLSRFQQPFQNLLENQRKQLAAFL